MTALYVLHRWVGLPLPAASALAVELAVIHNYLLNDWWTFAVRAPSIRRFVKFNASVLSGLAVNVFVVWSLTSMGTYFLVANGLGIAAGFALNFASSMAWVWGRVQ
jgi:putative flippase GtrA